MKVPNSDGKAGTQQDPLKQKIVGTSQVTLPRRLPLSKLFTE